MSTEPLPAPPHEEDCRRDGWIGPEDLTTWPMLLAGRPELWAVPIPLPYVEPGQLGIRWRLRGDPDDELPRLFDELLAAATRDEQVDCVAVVIGHCLRSNYDLGPEEVVALLDRAFGPAEDGSGLQRRCAIAALVAVPVRVAYGIDLKDVSRFLPEPSAN